MEGEKQGRLGNLEKMTIPQLQQLLNGQEKLLSQQRFLNTLPDKGQKVRDFSSRLRHMISQGGRGERRSQPPHSSSPHQPTSAKTEQRSPDATTLMTSHIGLQSVTVRDSDHVSRVPSVGDGEDAVDSTAMLSDAIDSLVISELSAPRMTDKVRDTPSDGGNLETRFPNSYEKVIKRNLNPETKKEPFRPNRSLKIRAIDQLPEDYKCKSRVPPVVSSGSQGATGPADAGGSGKTKEPKVEEDSAVPGPRYRFQGAKEISLQESLVLQRRQQENLQKIQTLNAAERLAERLNIKTLDYNPSSLDMEYRSSAVDEDGNVYDSDDDSDAAEHELDAPE